MFRTIFIYFSKASWAQRLVTGWRFAWRAASRFVAGNTIQDAIGAVKELNQKGIDATLDHLGESTSTREEAVKAANDIIELLEEINKNNVRANVSVKLTQIGLALDENLCAQNLERILAAAKKNTNFVRVDMEDTPYTDQTKLVFFSRGVKDTDNTNISIKTKKE